MKLLLFALIFLMQPLIGHAADTCRNVCRRLDECKLKQYDDCMDYCSAHPLTDRGDDHQSKWSCKKLASFVQANSRPAARSREEPISTGGDACSTVCRREDECNLYSYGNCMKACGPGDASKYLAAAKGSCEKLAVATGFAKEYTSRSPAGQWSCRAVGSFVHASNGAPDYSSPSNIDITKWGRTRDLAGFAALKECSGMMSLETNQAITPGTLTTDFCKVLRCSR